MDPTSHQSAIPTEYEVPSTPQVFSWLHALIIFLVFMAAGLLCQWGGMEARTVYDGAYFVSSKQAVFESHDVMRVIAMIPARPLFLFTFYVNYLATGLDPFFLRVGNVAIVAAGGLALTLLIGMILSMTGSGLPGSRRAKQAAGFLAGLLFVIHPLQSFAILYVWQREAAMACLFVFSGLAVYVATLCGRFPRPTVGYVLTSVIFLAGMLSKENVAILPPLLIAVELILFRRKLSELIDRAAIIAVTLLPSVMVYLLITGALHAPHSELERGIVHRLSVYYAAGGLSFVEVVMTQCRVFFSYLSMMLFPFGRDVEFMRAVTVSRSLVNPPETVAAVAGVLAVAVLGVFLVRRCPVIAFGIGLLMLSLLPEALLIPQYLFFGYRAILPMAGLLLIGAWAAQPAFDWVTARSKTAPALACSAVAAVFFGVCGLGWVTAERAARWTHISFWTDLSDRLPPYSADVQKTPFLDITANCMSVLTSDGRHADTIGLFHHVAAAGAQAQATNADGVNTNDAIEQFVTLFGDTGGRAGGALISLGVALQHLGREDEAVAAYRKSVELDSSHSDVLVSLGVLLERRGSIQEAIAYYRKATEANPASAVAYNCLGNALKKSGLVFEAMQEYAKAIAVDPQATLGRYFLAMALHETGYLQEAADHYRKALEVDETSPDIHHKLGRVLAEQGQLVEACVQYRRAISLQPGLAIARADLALALEMSGELRAALDQYQEALRADPDAIALQMFFGRALISAGRFADAATVLNRALALDPGQPAVHHFLGTALERRGHFGEAVSHMKKAVELAPGFADAHRNLGIALCRSGNCAEGIRHLKTAEVLEPAEPRTVFYLGWAMEATGSPDVAEAYFRTAVGLRPDLAEAHYGLARALHAGGKLQEAIEAYRMAVNHGPHVVEAHADMAVALLQLGRIPEAVVTLGKALALNRESVQLLYALGAAYARMNDHAEAVKYLKKALDMNPDHAAAAALLHRLQHNRED